MDAALTDFLVGLTPRLSETRWWSESLRMTMESYTHDVLPPEPYVTSVRAIVLSEFGVAVCHNPNGWHVLPGGRRQRGEGVMETLRREVLEETGCQLAHPNLLGFIHFRHLTPRPDDYAYPYPDFVQVVFGALATTVEPTVDPDGWEQRVEFAPVEDVSSREMAENERMYLDEAVRVLRTIA